MRGISRIIIGLVAVVIAVGMAALWYVGSSLERDWSIAADVSDLEGHVYRLNGLEWQAIAEGRVAPANGREAHATIDEARTDLAQLRDRANSVSLRRFSVALTA